MTSLLAARVALINAFTNPSSAVFGSSALMQSLKSLALNPSQQTWTQITSLIPSLSDVALLAVPKRKVTPHRKGNRSATKHIRFVPIVSQCSKCERIFAPHTMPSKCEEDDCPAFNLKGNPRKDMDSPADQ